MFSVDQGKLPVLVNTGTVVFQYVATKTDDGYKLFQFIILIMNFMI